MFRSEFEKALDDVLDLVQKEEKGYPAKDKLMRKQQSIIQLLKPYTGKRDAEGQKLLYHLEQAEREAQNQAQKFATKITFLQGLRYKEKLSVEEIEELKIRFVEIQSDIKDSKYLSNDQVMSDQSVLAALNSLTNGTDETYKKQIDEAVELAKKAKNKVESDFSNEKFKTNNLIEDLEKRDETEVKLTSKLGKINEKINKLPTSMENVKSVGTKFNYAFSMALSKNENLPKKLTQKKLLSIYNQYPAIFSVLLDHPQAIERLKSGNNATYRKFLQDFKKGAAADKSLVLGKLENPDEDMQRNLGEINRTFLKILSKTKPSVGEKLHVSSSSPLAKNRDKLQKIYINLKDKINEYYRSYGEYFLARDKTAHGHGIEVFETPLDNVREARISLYHSLNSQIKELDQIIKQDGDLHKHHLFRFNKPSDSQPNGYLKELKQELEAIRDHLKDSLLVELRASTKPEEVSSQEEDKPNQPYLK